MRRILGLATIGIFLALGSLSAHADPIPVTIDLDSSNGTGLGGQASFLWDESTGAVTEFVLTFDAYGSFAGGENADGPLDLGAILFDGEKFTSAVSIWLGGGLTILFRDDGTFQGYGGRIRGSYFVAGEASYLTFGEEVSVPEPGTLILLALGLLGLGLVELRKKTV